MIDYSIQCQECKAYGGNHSVFCSQQTSEQIKETLRQYYNAWLIGQKELHARYAKWNKEILFWQGKCATLKHENNQLRNKLRKAGIIK